MKKILFPILAVILTLTCTLSVSAAKAECSLTLPDNFTVAAQSDDLQPLADIFGIKADSLSEYYTDNNVLYLAANEDNTCQVTLSAVKNEFSEGAVSFSRLSDTELETIAADLAADSFQNLGITESEDGNRFIKLCRTLTDSGGEYTVTEYITVCSYKLFTLSVSVSSDVDSNLPQTAFEGLKINDLARPDDGEKGFIYTALAAAGIAVFATVAVYFTITVIKDLRNKETSDD